MGGKTIAGVSTVAMSGSVDIGTDGLALIIDIILAIKVFSTLCVSLVRIN